MGSTPDPTGVVALVTGGTRGVGKGCAVGLAEYGATVHVTGRSAKPGLDGAITSHVVDHASDEATERVLSAVIKKEGRLDILVNSAWPSYERMVTGGRSSWADPA